MPPKFVLILLLVFPVATLAVQPQFTDEERQYLKNKGEVLMCIDPNWMPYEKIEDAQHIGMTRDYMEIFSERLDIPITLVPTATWSQSIEYAKARKCDIYSLAMSTPERNQYMNFTTPYLSVPLVVTTRLDELFIADIADVASKQLGIVKGYAFVELLKAKYPDINLVEVDSLDDGMDMVAKGRLYGFIGTLSSVGYAIQRQFIGELKVAGKFDEKWELGIGVRNDDPMLLQIFEKVVTSVEHSTGQDIMNHWISVKYDKGVDYSLVWKVAVTLFVIILAFAYRQYVLAKVNHKLERLNKELEFAMEEIKTLQGIIPICSYCHNIRDDEGAWNQLVEYLSKHSKAKFSHGICPKCLEKALKEEGLDKDEK